MKINKIILNSFFSLVLREITVFLSVFKSKIIDVIIISTTNIAVFAFIMPYFGLKKSYGEFIFSGVIFLIAFFEVIGKANEFIADLSYNKKISYFLTLPLPSTLTLMSVAVGWAINNMILIALILPIGKLLAYNQIVLTSFSIVDYFFVFVTGNFFLGFFALWLSALIKEMKYLSWIWARVVNPMFMFGCYFYSWKTVFAMSKYVGVAFLFNPLVYLMEGMRAAFLGRSDYIPFWLSILVLWSLTVLFGMHGIYLLKKRLDCV